MADDPTNNMGLFIVVLGSLIVFILVILVILVIYKIRQENQQNPEGIEDYEVAKAVQGKDMLRSSLQANKIAQEVGWIEPGTPLAQSERDDAQSIKDDLDLDLLSDSATVAANIQKIGVDSSNPGESTIEHAVQKLRLLPPGPSRVQKLSNILFPRSASHDSGLNNSSSLLLVMDETPGVSPKVITDQTDYGESEMLTIRADPSLDIISPSPVSDIDPPLTSPSSPLSPPKQSPSHLSTVFEVNSIAPTPSDGRSEDSTQDRESYTTTHSRSQHLSKRDLSAVKTSAIGQETSLIATEDMISSEEGDKG
ncbi:hypothetical protein ADUPG1_009118 [Aduncisulcus paluster]|uniref:Uncharacterized protein n=1 Tax=Aduncisulcus paluster TaxID=2918883 RepID=A0ABQ5KXD0_9EUKA|nr:hypothetical protein ADUPG1_009118 [Aduncisulcus paluster]